MNININNLHVHGYIGVSDEEKSVGQQFNITLKLVLNDNCIIDNDDLEATVNYAEVVEVITDYFDNKRCDLIETACNEIASLLLQRYHILSGVEVTIRKPDAPIDADFDDIYVNCNKKWETAYLSLGSNIGDKKGYILDAFLMLKNNSCIRNARISKLYDTKPYGKVDQDDFVNAVCELETCFTPYELLDVIGEIENEHGRVREEKWGPRTLDIDIVLFGDKIINTPKLCIPHIDMHNREFVLKPLVEIAPFAYNPMTGKRAVTMYEDIR